MQSLNQSRTKKFYFLAGFIYITGLIIFAEFFSFMALSIMEKKIVSPSHLYVKRTGMLSVNDNHSAPCASGNEDVAHPYLGFVLNNTNSKINEFGFFDKDGINPVDKNNNSAFVVGIFGGSVAENFCYYENEMMKKMLQTLPGNLNKEIKIFSIALGGYKQPQQLLALNYLLSLGAHFDIIINIDGFNEVALPIAENLPKNVYPFYPRNWYQRVGSTLDASYISWLGKLTVLKENRAIWINRLNSFPLRASYLADLLWRLKYKVDEYRMNAIRLQMHGFISTSKDAKSNNILGPKYVGSDIYEDIARQWARSSIQMNQVAKANKIRYYHFLQPNQYLMKKDLSREELATAYSKDNDAYPYKSPAIKGYPYLIKLGPKLIEAGVKFYDETDLFKGVTETLYIDPCCHFNQKGNDILLRQIFQEIRNDYL